MKIRKPEDERFFKDIVLNDILEEIYRENGSLPPKSTNQTKKQKLPGKKIFILFLGIVFMLIIFKLLTDTKSTPTNRAKVVKSQHVQEPKVEIKKVNLPKERKNPSQNRMTKPKITPVQKTERELAKEALRRALLN